MTMCKNKSKQIPGHHAGWIMAFLCLLMAPLAARAAVWVTDENDVVYDIVDQQKMTVNVSNNNASVFSTRSEAIHIPATVIDHSTTASSQLPYTVVGIANQAFMNSAITSIVIDAPVKNIPIGTFSGCANLTSASFNPTIEEIGSNAFSGCSSLTNIEGIENVTKIGLEAFMNCTSLTSFTVPEKVTILNRTIFKGCTALESVTLPPNLTEISINCFDGCISLKAPEFPASLTTIQSQAFIGCSSLGRLVLSEGLTRLGDNSFKNCGITEIVWPESAITTLGIAIFSNNSLLTSVTIPGWMETIPKNTFYQSADLEEVKFLDGVANIGQYAFQESPKLKKIVFSQTPVTISDAAFLTCTSLSEIQWPPRMTSILYRAFEKCSALEDLVLPPMDKLEKAFVDTDLKSITFPSEPITEIASNPFGKQSSITSMTFPGWMTTLPESICNNWDSLSSVTFNDGVEKISRQDFYSCDALSEVNFPNTLISIGIEAFAYNTSLLSVTLPASLDSICEEAFLSAPFTELVIPENVSYIGKNAFSTLKNLTKVTIKSKVPLTLDYGAFYMNDLWNTKLEVVDIGQFEEGGQLVPIVEIGDYCFYQHRLLAGFPLPSTLKKIGKYAFSKCRAYGPLTLLPDLEIGDGAFLDAGVSSITFPETACTFGSNVFKTNSLISEIDFPEWMTAIPNGFCYEWSLLSHIDLPEHVDYIGKDAFRSCRKLHDVDLPETVRYIGQYAFATCGGTGTQTSPYFGKVDLYDGVVIDNQAFFETTVTKLIFHGCADFRDNCFQKVTTISEITFPDCMTEIPAGFCNSWKNLTHVEFGKYVTSIGNETFKNCTKLTSITFPATLNKIGDECFKGSGLESITWPEEKIDSIGKGAFSGTAIKSLTIPRWMSDIPDECFKECKGLESITWEERSGDPEEISLNIGDRAFSSCTFLKEVQFPDYPINFGDYAFHYCNGMTKVRFSETAPITLGKHCFAQNSKLAEINFPPTFTEIPDYCFNGDTSLAVVDMGNSSVTSIGYSAFNYSGVHDITWPENISFIDEAAFSQTKLESVTIPDGVNLISAYCFYKCSDLKTVNIHEGVTQINDGAFMQCSSLEGVEIPGSVTEIKESAFRLCSSLEYATLHDGLEKIRSIVFQDCSSLKRIEFPSTLTSVGEKCFIGCSALEEVINHGENILFDNFIFQDDKALKHFYSDGAIYRINQGAFSGCSALEDFIYESETPIGAISWAAFRNCEKLREFNSLVSCEMGSNIFEGCTSLTQIRMPVEGITTRALDNPQKTFLGCTSLQSIVWPHTSKYFKVFANDIHNAPLRALSYSYARNITMPTTYLNVSPTAREYKPDDEMNVTTPELSTLMVVRGEKWKYIEQGYGQVFNIIEMRDPQFNITGDIWSEFKPAQNVNHYKALLRWDVPLSDLNPNGPTEVEVFRDGVKVADVEFNLHPETEHIEGLPCDQVYVVDVKVNGQPNSFRGDFDFPVEDANGNIVWVMRYNIEGAQMYFDANSEKRMLDFDKYGYTSWFTLVDEFDSPPLDSPNIPESYVYTARMKGYSYTEPENNEGLEPDENGRRYHYVEKSFESITSDPCKLHVAFAAPSITFKGLYTTEEVKADTDHTLAVTPAHTSGTRYGFTYSMDPDLTAQQGRIESLGGSSSRIYNTVEIHEYDPEATMVEQSNAIGKASLYNASGTINLTQTNHAVEPGKKYQTVVRSLFRGTFGSPVMTIPDRPAVNVFLVAGLHEHQTADIPPTMHVQVALAPALAAVGYTEDEAGTAALANGDYFYGIWRNIDLGSNYRLYRAPAAQSGTLIHHADGVTEEGANSTSCGECAPLIGFTGSGSNSEGADNSEDADNSASGNNGAGDVYHDYYDLEWGQAHDVSYSGRLYVKVPKSMIPGEQMWMVTDTDASHSQATLLGLEEIAADADGNFEGCRFFDYRGIEVDAPLPGVPYIMVRPDGSTTKVRLTSR